MEIDSHVDENGDVDMIRESEERKGSRKERCGLTRLPIAKVKNVFKMDLDCNKTCQKNSYVVIAKMTELFLNELARNVHAVCKRAKRKTMNIEDIAMAIKQNEMKYGFIDIGSLFYVDVFNTHKKSKSVNARVVHSNTNNNNSIAKGKTRFNKESTKHSTNNNNNNNIINNNRTIESMFHKMK